MKTVGRTHPKLREAWAGDLTVRGCQHCDAMRTRRPRGAQRMKCISTDDASTLGRPTGAGKDRRNVKERVMSR